MTERCQVKGIFFVAARNFAIRQYGPFAVEEVARGAAPEAARTLREALSSAWYPEEHLQSCLQSMRLVLAGDDPARLVHELEACTVAGVQTFVSSLMVLADPVFVLKRTPTLWSLVRSGTGRVAVSPLTPQSVEVRYSHFPYFDDDNYEHLAVGMLQGLVRLCHRKATTRILYRRRTQLSVEVSWGPRISTGWKPFTGTSPIFCEASP